MKWWALMPWSLFFECWVLSQLFHSPLSHSIRGSLVPLHFQHKNVVICMPEPMIFILAIFILACASSIQVFYVVYSAYKFNKQDGNIQLWHVAFTIWNQFLCLVLTTASWPVYRFPRRQIRYFNPFKNFPQIVVIHTVKGFNIVNEAEIATFWEFSCLDAYSLEEKLWPT